MRKIIYTRPDGGVSVMAPAEGARLANKVLKAFGIVFLTVTEAIPVERISRKWKLFFGVEWAETEDEFVARIRQKDVPADAINVQIVDDSLIPADRTFRNAWKPDLTVDMPKAREIQERRIETPRRSKMLNLLVSEALGENVAADKDALRAINAKVLCQAAQTPDELKAVLPDILK